MTVATDRNLLFGPQYSTTQLEADRAGTKAVSLQEIPSNNAMEMGEIMRSAVHE